MVLFIILFAIIFALAIGLVFEKLFFSKLTMGKKTLPQRRVTQNTLREPTKPLAYCPECGKAFEGSNFCAHCGSPRKAKHRWEFPIKGKMSATDFESILNSWLADNPYVTDLKLHLETDTRLHGLYIPNQFPVKRASIEYRVDSKPQNYQYGLAFTYNCRLLGTLGYSYDKHIAKWNKNNADCSVISTHGTGRIQHWSNQGDCHAEYHSFILFKKPIVC